MENLELSDNLSFNNNSWQWNNNLGDGTPYVHLNAPENGYVNQITALLFGSDVRDEIVKIYQQYNPSEMNAKLRPALAKYAGREQLLLEKLRNKYVIPANSRSQGLTSTTTNLAKNNIFRFAQLNTVFSTDQNAFNAYIATNAGMSREQAFQNAYKSTSGDRVAWTDGQHVLRARCPLYNREELVPIITKYPEVITASAAGVEAFVNQQYYLLEFTKDNAYYIQKQAARLRQQFGGASKKRRKRKKTRKRKRRKYRTIKKKRRRKKVKSLKRRRRRRRKTRGK